MPTLPEIVEHPDPTDESGYRYQFTPKHHGAVPDAAQWLPSLTLDEEFAIFNAADEHDLSDDRGWLYGIQGEGDGLRDLGTWAQQMAEFPSAGEGQAWHGYPIWAVNELAPPNRRGQKMRPEKEVFLKMERAGLLTARLRKRLFKGDHV
jgi:hypothetical protein